LFFVGLITLGGWFLIARIVFGFMLFFFGISISSGGGFFQKYNIETIDELSNVLAAISVVIGAILVVVFDSNFLRKK